MERGRGGGGGVRRELFSTRALLPVIKRGRVCVYACVSQAFRLFKFYICRPMGAETSPALSLSFSALRVAELGEIGKGLARK